MAGTAGPRYGFIYGWSDHDEPWGDDMNANLAKQEILTHPTVVDVTHTAAPVSPVTGDAYIVQATATGTWTGHENDLAWWTGAVWRYIPPGPGLRVWNLDTSEFWVFDGVLWAVDTVAPVTGGDGGVILVLDTDQSGPPVSPSSGDVHLVNPASAAGDWTGHSNDIATWDGADWTFTDATIGQIIHDQNTSQHFTYVYRAGVFGWSLLQIPETVNDATTTAPPGSPAVLDAYLVPVGASGAWALHEDQIAYWNGGIWRYEPAVPGRRVRNLDTNTDWVGDTSVSPMFIEEGGIHDYSGAMYTLSIRDRGNRVRLSHSSTITLTVPAGLGVPYDVPVIQGGAGEIVFYDDGGDTTIVSRPGYTETAGTGAVMVLQAIAADSFILSGDGA